MEEQVDSFIKTTVGEIERLISTRTVVGEPLTIEGATVIPLLSIGFFFGAASASAKGEVKQKTEGNAGVSGIGTGAAGVVKPVAVVIMEKGGVRIEPLTFVGGLGTVIEKIGETIPRMIRRRGEQKKEGEQ